MEENIHEQKLKEATSPLNSASGGLAFTVLVILYFILQLIASIIITAITKNVMAVQGIDQKDAIELVQNSEGYVYFSYLLSPLMITLCTLIILKTRKIKLRQVFPVKTRPKYYLIALLLIFGLLFSLSWINDLSVQFFKLFGYIPREASSYFPDLSGGKVVLALLVMAVMPAFFEELMFRGILLNCGENDLGTVRAVLITGFCFSLFHTSPEQTVYQFIAGCAFALIAARSGSILPSVLMHFINNALIVILQSVGAFNEQGEFIMSQGANVALIVLSAVSLVTALILLIVDKAAAEKIKGLKRVSFIFEHKPLKKYKKGSVKDFFIWASVAVAALGLVWILLLFGIV